jgi:L-Ala-D/L-Glu epimerase
MKLTFNTVLLKLNHPFTISRGSSTTRQSIIVQIEDDNLIGYGEAAPSERYGENIATVSNFLSKVNLYQFEDPFLFEDILKYVNDLAEGNTSAKAAIDIALHDWVGKKLKIPLWKLWGFSNKVSMPTSFTIGYDSSDVIEKKIEEAKPYFVLKVKMGFPDDEKVFEIIRSLTNKIIRVDANEGWKTKEEAKDKILWLEKQNVEFVEQPMPANQLADIKWLRQQVQMQLVADESVKASHDIHALHGIFDGINIKLMKCAGLREALRMIRTAKTFGMKVMLGCMIESSIGISAAAQLMPIADFIDLDGNLLISNDPFNGVHVINGKLKLNESHGIGVSPKE